MNALRLDRFLDVLTSAEFFVGVLWAGLAVITLGLLALMLTHWGQYHVVRKCLILSLLAHLLLAGYSTTVQIFATVPGPRDRPIRVAISDERFKSVTEASVPPKSEKPWEQFVEQSPVRPEPQELARIEPERTPEPKRHALSEPVRWAIAPSVEQLPLASASEKEPDHLAAEEAAAVARVAKAAEPIEAPAPQRREGQRHVVPMHPEPSREGHAEAPTREPARQSRAGLPAALQENPVRIPRLDDTAMPVESPADLLAGPTDPASSAQKGQPAELYTSPAPPNAAAQGPSMPEDQSPGPQHDQLLPPSLATRGAAGGSADPLDALASRIPGVGPPLLPVRRRPADHQIPDAYKLRTAPDRARLAERQGATPETERAVKAALKWLADNQESDGRWNARRHGAGRETRTAGRDRQGAGSHADTGMTGLALLAFLASGHTHQDGDYRDSVRRGVEFLLRIQRSDGGLGGDAANFEYMYCHAMATLALSEALGMTGDPALEGPVRKALRYTLANQNPTSGGWRYNPWDPGDTSQLGWQWMALKSGELAGIPIPADARAGVIRFLGSVSYGVHRGLAAYRPGEAVTRPMTAEALVCRQLLGLSPESPSAREAGASLLEQLPGQGEDNVYYWYYATLAMYQLQGVYWARWNEALQARLVATQLTKGPAAGSWDPDPIWGGYGGRVYSTALSALCLEVYYRYLPLYLHGNNPDARPAR